MVSKIDSVFLNPANNCLVETGSSPLAGLAHARIFYRCYSLVLNVANLEGTRMLAAMLAEMLAATALLVSRTDLWCCMFL